MTRPRISIALATCNGERFLDEQLESLASQQRPPDELVVTDDASQDDTCARVERFAARAPFEVRLVRNPTRLLTTPNFAKAIALTTGDLVFLCDQDDFWQPEKLAVMEAWFADHPRAGAAFHRGQVCDEALEPLGHDLWQALWFDATEQRKVREGRATEVFARHVVAAGMSLGFRGEYRALVDPFPDLHDCHDAWVSFLVASVAEVGAVEADLVRYRVHGSNQFGIRQPGLLEQIRKARWQLREGLFDHGLVFFGAIRDRLQAPPARYQPRPGVLELVDAKLAHLGARAHMDGGFVARLPAIARETASRRYWRFSYGSKSVLQDLFLR